MSWFRVMERTGGGVERAVAWLRTRRERAEDRRIGEIATAEREHVVEQIRVEEVEREPLVVVPSAAPLPRSERIVKEKQRPLFTELPDSSLPPLSLLEDAPPSTEQVSADTLDFTSRLIERKLADFGVAVKVLAAYPGPVITRFEIEPAVGVKGAQIVNLMKDLARALSVVSIRVVETIPGKSCMALELPNAKRQIVKLVEILASTTYNDAPGALTLALGKDIAGKAVIADLARMPHLLVAGTTGSGKSVAVNAMILSLLYKAEPKHVRLILIDPKMLELSVYEGIPHLLAPVVTDMKLAPNALHWCVGEMERRYKLMSPLGVRNLAGYNQRIAEAKKAGKPLLNPVSLTPESPEPLDEMPLIVVVVDELADLMMVTGKKIEELIARIAQKARAAGIHLILATQRPSVDVITGLIKANIPSRIAFQVASKVDSRTILDQMGAETLLGQGDMLYLPPGTGYPLRVHGAFVSDAEVHRVVEHLKSLGGPQYLEGILEGGGERRRRRGGRFARCRRRGSRPDVRPGGQRRAEDAPAVDLAGAAAPAHRLQPRGAADRADGACRARVADAVERQSRRARSRGQRRAGVMAPPRWRAAARRVRAASAAHAFAGPVEVYRTGPEFCPRDRAASAPVLSEAADHRARAIVAAARILRERLRHGLRRRRGNRLRCVARLRPAVSRRGHAPRLRGPRPQLRGPRSRRELPRQHPRHGTRRTELTPTPT